MYIHVISNINRAVVTWSKINIETKKHGTCSKSSGGALSWAAMILSASVGFSTVDSPEI